MYEILTRIPPWPGVEKNTMIKMIIAGERPLLPDTLKRDESLRELKDLMIECWSQDPSNRPTAAAIISRVNARQ